MAPPLDKPAAETASEWVITFTSPRNEDVLERVLRARRFASYVPAMTVTRRRSTVSHPLFPRYVFVGLQPDQQLYGLRGTPGLEGVLRSDGRPFRVAPDVLDGIRENEKAGVYDFTAAREAEHQAKAQAEAYAAKLRALVPGITVRITGGPFRQMTAKVDALMDARRVGLLLRLFGGKHVLPVPVDDVELIAGAAP